MWPSLHCVIVEFPDHTHLLFVSLVHIDSLSHTEGGGESTALIFSDLTV